MKLKAIIGIVAIVTAFVLDYVPIIPAILIYGIIGGTLGSLFVRVNRWAQEGLAFVAGGAVIAVLIDQVLPSMVEDAVSQLSGVKALLVKSFPLILKAGIIWGAVVGLLQKLRRISWK